MLICTSPDFPEKVVAVTQAEPFHVCTWAPSMLRPGEVRHWPLPSALGASM
jgi:hypothetical protein